MSQSHIAEVLPLAWQKALAIVPKVSGGLSFLGSTWIVFEVLRDRRKRGAVYHRLVLGMSFYCSLSSFWLFLSSWPMPAGSWYGATGNERTCTAQGFFLSIDLAVPIYNSSLSLYYLLQIRYNWRDAKFAKRVEGWVHGVATLLPLARSIVPIPLQMYRPGHTPWCHIEWNECIWRAVECNQTYDIILSILTYSFYLTIWLCTIFSAICMVLVYRTVRVLERRVSRYTTFPQFNRGTDAEESKSREMSKKSRQVAFLGLLYMSVYILTWTLPSVAAVFGLHLIGTSDRGYLALMTVAVVLYPLQGFFNWLIYIRPRFVKYTRQHPEWPSWRVFRMVIQRPFTIPNAADGDYKLDTVAGEDTGNNAVDDNNPA